MSDYSVRALYDIIKVHLLLKNKDLVRFVRVTNDEILSDFNKIKNKSNMPLNDIINKHESYTIVYMMIRGIMADANINKHQENAREITNMFLEDELEKPSNDKSKSVYDSDD